jgi:peptidoglycan/LPS O-acetylase OafA/YrhL
MNLNTTRLYTAIHNKKRIYGLDILRAIAVCLIVYEHGNFIIDTAFPALAGIKIIDGVDLFFVLSGFLIGGLLLRNLKKEEKITVSLVKTFLIRRWFRTLPNYFLFLALNILLVFFGLTNGYINKYLVTFFLFMQSFFKPYDFLFWESWSLVIEEWFYLIFPILLLVIAAIGFLKNNRKYIFMFSALLLILFSNLVRLYKAGTFSYSYDIWDLWVRKLAICRFDGIGFGLVAAWIHFYYPKSWAKSKWLCLTAGLILYFFILRTDFEHNTCFMKTFYFSVSAIASMLILPAAEQYKTHRSAFGKLITFISLISYAMYLSNLGIVGSLIRHHVNYLAHPAFIYLVYWCGVISLSTIVYIFFEDPMTRLRDRFT